MIKPIIVNNSSVPKVLSKIAPIEIFAIAVFPFIFCRGKLGQQTKQHEMIHFQQQLELLVLPFYIIYLYDYIKARLSGMSGRKAYKEIRAEKEAHDNDRVIDYLKKRKRWRWLIK